MKIRHTHELGVEKSKIRERTEQSREVLLKRGVIHRIVFKSAGELIRYLDAYQLPKPGPISGNPRVIFRGQDDANNSLLPSAWRPDFHDKFAITSFEYHPALGRIRNLLERGEVKITPESFEHEGVDITRSVTDAYLHIRKEIDLVRAFWIASNYLGIEMPTPEPPKSLDGVNLDILQDICNLNSGEPSFELNSTIALAQHSGVPTRLLDFTLNPFVAAFYALSKEGTQETPPAVFALDQRLFRQYEVTRIYNEVLRTKNPFLHAQDGLFLSFFRGTSHFVRKWYYPSLEDQFVADFGRLEEKDLTFFQGGLKILELQAGDAKELRRLLRERGYFRMRMMPTLQNVASEVLREFDLEDELTP